MLFMVTNAAMRMKRMSIRDYFNSYYEQYREKAQQI
jgi:hypothetical protein